MTKRDLLDEVDPESMSDFVSKKELLQKKKEHSCTNFSTTSSKAWSDFNVHKAFNNIIKAGELFKYENKPGQWEWVNIIQVHISA